MVPQQQQCPSFINLCGDEVIQREVKEAHAKHWITEQRRFSTQEVKPESWLSPSCNKEIWDINGADMDLIDCY